MKARTRKFLSIKGRRSVDSFHRELGLLMWDLCGMARTEASLTDALTRLAALREEPVEYRAPLHHRERISMPHVKKCKVGCRPTTCGI